MRYTVSGRFGSNMATRSIASRPSPIKPCASPTDASSTSCADQKRPLNSSSLRSGFCCNVAFVRSSSIESGSLFGVQISGPVHSYRSLYAVGKGSVNL